MQVYDDRFQAESGLCLEAVIRNLHETNLVPNVEWKIPDGGQRGCPKHVVL